MSAHLALTIVAAIGSTVSLAAAILALAHIVRPKYRRRQVPFPVAAAWTGGSAIACAANILSHSWIMVAVNVVNLTMALLVVGIRQRTIRMVAETEALREQAARQAQFYRPGMWN